jgi:hypothetical protein
MFLFYSVNALKNSKKQRKILPCELKVTFLFNPCELFTHSELLHLLFSVEKKFYGC